MATMAEETPIADAADLLSRAMRSGKYSDLTLSCHGRDFRVHKIIVCPQSSVLAAAADEQSQGSDTSAIEMNSFGREIVAHMVEFLYTGDYGTRCFCKVNHIGRNTTHRGESETPIWDRASIHDGDTHHILVAVIARHYKIDSLAELACLKLKTAYGYEWNPDAWASAVETALAFEGDYKFVHTLSQALVDNLGAQPKGPRVKEAMNSLSDYFTEKCRAKMREEAAAAARPDPVSTER